MKNANEIIKSVIAEMNLTKEEKLSLSEQRFKESGIVEIFNFLADRLSKNDLTVEEKELKDRFIKLSLLYINSSVSMVRLLRPTDFDSFFTSNDPNDSQSYFLNARFKKERPEEDCSCTVISGNVYNGNPGKIYIHICIFDGSYSSVGIALPCTQDDLLRNIVSEIFSRTR